MDDRKTAMMFQEWLKQNGHANVEDETPPGRVSHQERVEQAQARLALAEASAAWGTTLDPTSKGRLAQQQLEANGFAGGFHGGAMPVGFDGFAPVNPRGRPCGTMLDPQYSLLGAQRMALQEEHLRLAALGAAQEAEMRPPSNTGFGQQKQRRAGSKLSLPKKPPPQQAASLPKVVPPRGGRWRAWRCTHPWLL